MTHFLRNDSNGLFFLCLLAPPFVICCSCCSCCLAWQMHPMSSLALGEKKVKMPSPLLQLLGPRREEIKMHRPTLRKVISLLSDLGWAKFSPLSLVPEIAISPNGAHSSLSLSLSDSLSLSPLSLLSLSLLSLSLSLSFVPVFAPLGNHSERRRGVVGVVWSDEDSFACQRVFFTGRLRPQADRGRKRRYKKKGERPYGVSQKKKDKGGSFLCPLKE